METKEFYRLLFENSKDIIFVVTPDGRYIDINPAGVEFFGYESREEMLGLDIGTDIYADPAERLEFRRKLEEDGFVKDHRIVVKRKDGERRIVLATAHAVRNGNGEIIAYQGINHDITERERAAEALIQANDLLRVIIDTVPTAIIGIDTEERVRMVWNRAAEKMFGWSAEEVMGRPLPIVPEKSGGEFRENQVRVRKGETVHGREVRRRRKDGTTVDCSLYITPLYDEKGAFAGSIGVLADITERRRMDEALRESEERLKLTLDAAHIVAWEVNVEKGHLEVGPVHELFGRPEGFRHPGLVDLFRSVHPDDREALETMIWAALRGERDFGIEFRVPLEDGTVRWIEATGTLQRDAEGKPSRLLGIARNVTEGKLAEEALRRSEERFKRLVQNSNDVITLIDERGTISSVSGPLERITGYRPEELVGKPATDHVHPDDIENVRRVFGETLREPGRNVAVEYRARHKEGRWISVEAVSTNLLADPVVSSLVVTHRDISERMRLQEQLQQAMKMEAVGRLAGGIAHDFNNILTVVTGNAELARMSLSASDPLVRPLDQVMKAAGSAASLTRQLLAFSRKQIIEPRVLSLNDLVRNIQQMLVRLIGENVTFKASLGEELGSVKVDPGQFEQVLVNLAVNARDAMPEGGSLFISTSNVVLDGSYCASHPQSNPGEYVLLSVSDTGHGMTDEVKRHLFEPFFTTKGKGLGTGLGLATIFGVVRQAGGAIQAYSETGMGTTFKIYLPRVASQAERLVREGLPLERLKGSETILLVEDEETVRQVASRILGDLGYKVIEARSGEEALMLADWNKGRIDLLMTDIVMPGMNGRELSERMSKTHPSMKTLFTSGYTEDVIVHHGILDSNLDFIGKPYTVQALAAKIRSVLKPRKSGGN
ncbi:MAG: PAS domain S-box protein [Thermodesulfobacteriota bacterium]